MLGFESPELYERTRGVFLGCGYTEDGLRSHLGLANLLSVPALALPGCLRRTKSLSSLDVLIRLFFLDEAVPDTAVREAVVPMSLEEWIDAGLCRTSEHGMVDGLIQMTPWHGFLVAADRPYLNNVSVERDFVPPPGGATSQLADMMLRVDSERTLDLGTGPGPLALLASKHSRAVVATDILPKALTYARFNLRLNGLEEVAVRGGDGLEPVRGETFSQVICNAPFVVSPSNRLVFRDGAGGGDAFCRHLIRSVPDVLEEGGVLQMMCNVPRRRDQSLDEALSDWFADTGLDAVVWCDRSQAIADYAMTWLVSTESLDPRVVTRQFSIWMDYYEKRGIDRIDYVFMTLRKRPGPRHWVHVERGLREVSGPCGDDVIRSITALDILESHGERHLLDCVPVLAPEVRLTQTQRMEGGNMQEVRTQIDFVSGSSFSVTADSRFAGLLASCNGKATLRVLLSRMAEALDLAETRLQEAVLPMVAQFVRRGMILLASTPEPEANPEGAPTVGSPHCRDRDGQKPGIGGGS